MEYGKKMDALRTELRDYFWDGEFRDTVGATVTEEGGSHNKRYTVFENKKNGRIGVVVANYAEDGPMKVLVRADNGQKFEKYRIVGEDGEKAFTGTVEIPPRSAAVLY